MEKNFTIRVATTEDAASIVAIYAPYVQTTAVTFELDVPTVEEYKVRIANTLINYPFLVAEDETGIIGYTYASAFRSRLAYLHSVETSIYVKQDYRGKGLGRALYTALSDVLAAQNVFNMNACIAHAEADDPYVPPTSRAFHERMGFVECAHFNKSGRKFHRWYDIVWMERFTGTGEHPEMPERFIPFSQLESVPLPE